MKTDNLNPFFDEMRKSGFLFSSEDAVLVMINNQSVKNNAVKTRIVVSLAVFLVAISLFVFIYMKMNHTPALSTISQKVVQNKPAIQNKVDQVSRDIIMPGPHNIMPDKNNFIPGNANAFAKKDSSQEIVNQNTASIYLPGVNNFFSIIPSPLVVKTGSVDFRIPDMSDWSVYTGLQSCSSEEDKVNSDLGSQRFGTERLDSVKLIVCTDEEYAKLGIHKTKSGIFIQFGENFIVCYNRHAMYSSKSITGNMAAPLPVLVTDDYGVKVRSYMFTEPGIAMRKASLSKQYPSASKEISDFSPSQVLMTTINTLIPVLVVNKQDTSHGVHSSNIIVWYDPEGFIFRGLVPEDLKAKLLNNNAAPSSSIKLVKAQNDSALNNIVYQQGNSSVKLLTVENLWSEFQLYPNPVCIEFNLSFNLNDNKNLKVNLFDISGRLVKTLHPESLFPKGKTDFKFNLSGLKTGMYIIAVEASTGEIWTQRLIKQ